MRSINISLTPENFSAFSHIKDPIVVVVDILRATSVISTAFHYGIKEVIPVKSVDQAKNYLKTSDYIVAAERNALPIEGFDYGNSPFQYMNKKILNKTLVLTTTNGTKAINIASENQVITASYINFNSICRYLIQSNKNIIILCSGWKGVFNLEDSIFAGYLTNEILKNKNYISNCDSVKASIILYNSSKNNLFEFLSDSAHRNRLKHLNMEKDTTFCLCPNFKSDIIPFLDNGKLKPLVLE
jgi:2-phosphosulfolactate phosphatase